MEFCGGLGCPGDFLPEARSVVVMGLRIPEGAIESNHRACESGLRHGIFTYLIFGYNKLNEVSDKAAMKVGLYLEREVKRKVYFISSSVPRDEYLMMGGKHPGTPGEVYLLHRRKRRSQSLGAVSRGAGV